MKLHGGAASPLLDESGHVIGAGELDCWCSPTFHRECPECGDSEHDGCWLCEGIGSLECDLDYADDADEEIVVAHYDGQLDEDDDPVPCIMLLVHPNGMRELLPESVWLT